MTIIQLPDDNITSNEISIPQSSNAFGDVEYEQSFTLTLFCIDLLLACQLLSNNMDSARNLRRYKQQSLTYRLNRIVYTDTECFI